MPSGSEEGSSAKALAAFEKGRAWYCLRSQPKHEHIVAAHLRTMDEVEVFLPRVRFKRATRQGIAWMTEALFPGYLFTQFIWKKSLRRIQTAPGVRGVVHFGQEWPVIADKTMKELRQLVGTNELHTIAPELAPGDSVQISDGTLRGLRAVISSVMPARERVAVLMQLLGRETMVELTMSSLIKHGDKRAGFLS